MRIRLILIALLFGWAMPASAGTAIMQCSQTHNCSFSPQFSLFYTADYTVPTDGQSYIWSLRLESADPNATVSLGGPNQVDREVRCWGECQITGPLPPIDYTFRTLSVAPLLTQILVSGPRAFNNCSQPGPTGAICGISYIIFGNDTGLLFSTTEPVRLFFSATPVPEPASWAMLIAGFGLAGAALRARARKSAVVTAG